MVNLGPRRRGTRAAPLECCPAAPRLRAICRRPEPPGQRLGETPLSRVSHPRHVAVRSDQDGGGSCDRSDHGKLLRPCATLPVRGTARRRRAGRGPRWCASAGRPRASRRAAESRAARRSRRRRSRAPARPRASVRSGRLPRSEPRALSSPAMVQQDAGLAASPPVRGILRVAGERVNASPRRCEIDPLLGPTPARSLRLSACR